MPEPMPGQGEQKQRPNYNRPVSQGQVIWTDAGVCVCVTLHDTQIWNLVLMWFDRL